MKGTFSATGGNGARHRAVASQVKADACRRSAGMVAYLVSLAKGPLETRWSHSPARHPPPSSLPWGPLPGPSTHSSSLTDKRLHTPPPRRDHPPFKTPENPRRTAPAWPPNLCALSTPPNPQILTAKIQHWQGRHMQ